MRLRLWIIPLIFLLSRGLFGQEAPLRTSDSPLRFLPGSPLLPRLSTSPDEARLGLKKTAGSSRLTLELGAAYDLLEYRADSAALIRLGVEAFARALSWNASGLRLQVDAADGFFGGHLLSCFSAQRNWFIRLRILHRSAHFLDGHLDPSSGRWRDDRAPIPYTRDYGELAILWARRQPLAIYATLGGGYATLIRPVEISRWTFFAGAELDLPLGEAWNQPAAFYASARSDLSGIQATIGTTSVEAGVRFGSPEEVSLRIFLNYHSGLDEFGEYYSVHDERWALGFALDT